MTDLLVNGTEEEKNQFSFALMDDNENGMIDFEGFYNFFQKVLMHWSSLINNHVRVNRDVLQTIFDEIDYNGDDQVDFREYSEALKCNPELINWYALLNPSSCSSMEEKLHLEQQKMADIDYSMQQNESQIGDGKLPIEEQMKKFGF